MLSYLIRRAVTGAVIAGVAAAASYLYRRMLDDYRRQNRPRPRDARGRRRQSAGPDRRRSASRGGGPLMALRRVRPAAVFRLQHLRRSALSNAGPACAFPLVVGPRRIV
jgi:hypothetical protein